MEITIWFCWCQNKLSCVFNIWCCKKQHMYCFLPFGFINVIIFVNNPFRSYSTFVGADLEYPISLSYVRSSWSEWDTSISNQVWNCDGVVLEIFTNSSDLRRVSGFFKVFKFWNFKNLSFCVRYQSHHYVQYQLLLENTVKNYCKSLLVYSIAICGYLKCSFSSSGYHLDFVKHLINV